jgi:hypothetical protein
MGMFRDQETAEQAITGVWYHLFDCDDIELVNEARALMEKWAEEYCGGLDESTLSICRAAAFERWEADQERGVEDARWALRFVDDFR